MRIPATAIQRSVGVARDRATSAKMPRSRTVGAVRATRVAGTLRNQTRVPRTMPGKATAWKLAEAGATVITIARDKEQLEATQREFEANGHKLEAYVGDVTDFAQVDALVQQILEDHGGELALEDAIDEGTGETVGAIVRMQFPLRQPVKNEQELRHEQERVAGRA